MAMLRILAFFKKLKAKKKKKREGEKETPSVPEVNRIAVFGHTNVGKTVYFVMAHEAAREDLQFRLDTKDDQTASELLSNLKLMKGLEVSVSEGARVEKKVERRFPPPTSETKALRFVAVLDQRKRFDFTSLDYRGEIASIEEQPELKEDLIQFCVESDCILFFIEPSVIFSELYCRNQLASFKSLLQLLVNGKRHLPIPVGLVVTKADFFDGFEDEPHAVLISRSCEHAKSKRYDDFIERLLDQPHIMKSERWRKDLRKILERLENFFETLSGLSLDYQVFFVSATGSKPPQKFDDKGGTIYVPPRQLKPIGVKEPFKWAVNRVLLQKKIRTFRKITKWVFWLAFIWCLFFSIPNLLNSGFWYPDIFSVEEEITQSGYRHDLSKLNDKELNDFKRRYERYSKRTFVSAFFGMGGLKDFARHRFDQLESLAPTPKQKSVVVDSAFVAEKEEYDKIVSEFQKLKTKINQGSATFRLEEAPVLLANLKSTLESSTLYSGTAKQGIKSMIDKIDRFFRLLECWDEKTFDITVKGIPKGYALIVKIGDSRYGRMFYDLNTWSDLSWKKGKVVEYIFENQRSGKEAEKKQMEGQYGIAESVLKFSEVGCTIEITKEGFDCRLPSL